MVYQLLWQVFQSCATKQPSTFRSEVNLYMNLILDVSMVLPSEEFFVPALNMVSADVFFKLLHLPILRKNDHHGSISFVGHHHDRSLVDRVLINVIAASSFHHVNLHGGVLVHFEVSFVGQFCIKWLVPLAYQEK